MFKLAGPLRRVQSTVGVSVLRSTASGGGDEGRVTERGVRAPGAWDQGASAISGDEALEFLEPIEDNPHLAAVMRLQPHIPQRGLRRSVPPVWRVRLPP